ncbi:uncharacterized protein RJT20DRAFT_124788 [Scheffersomyces xylosifermentans]|uniref:uncharacterized protein n=1 Tax=Scheffersomyces xylosifermentans TaxID=1304137 RepID=UPI00315C5ECC
MSMYGSSSLDVVTSVLWHTVFPVNYLRHKLQREGKLQSRHAIAAEPSLMSDNEFSPAPTRKRVSFSRKRSSESSSPSRSPSVVNRAQAKRTPEVTISSSNALAGRANSLPTSPISTSPPNLIFGPMSNDYSVPRSLSSMNDDDFHSAVDEQEYQPFTSYDSDPFLTHDYIIEMPLKLVHSNQSSYSYFPETNGDDNDYADMWSYNPEEGHTVIAAERKKSVRFT